jgi:hypothetical protein
LSINDFPSEKGVSGFSAKRVVPAGIEGMASQDAPQRQARALEESVTIQGLLGVM